MVMERMRMFHLDEDGDGDDSGGTPLVVMMAMIMMIFTSGLSLHGSQSK